MQNASQCPRSRGNASRSSYAPPVLLKGGHETEDPRLDRVPEFDERSRSFPIAAVVPEPLRSRSWPCPLVTDQGREGACVGHAWTHELAATPIAVRDLSSAYANGLYREAQRIDEWPGEDYSGTSVLAGAKILAGRGYMAEYRWAFGIDDVLRAISHAGPVVLGIPWLDSMYEPRPDGMLDCSGRSIGGHAILARGLLLRRWFIGSDPWPVVRLRNSWGSDWGLGGDCFIPVADLERLLADRGECCVPVGRRRPF